MATIDFDQRVEDHQCVLVLVIPVGGVSPAVFNKMYDKIVRTRTLPPHESFGTRYIRYVKTYIPHNNDWATFQLHRGVRGVIGISVIDEGTPAANVNLASLTAEFENTKSLYKSTLYDTRLLVFGLEYSPKPSIVEANGATAEGSESRQSPDIPELTSNGKSRPSTASDTSNTSAVIASGGIIAYSSVQQCDDLEERMLEFISSLFWVLESKRLSGLQERLDKLVCPYAPCEKRDAESLDSSGEGRSFKRRCQGRQRKQVGDMCLLSGLLEDALVHYTSAAEVLKQASDWLWYGNALEGLATTTVLIVFQHHRDQRRTSIPRNLSFTANSRRESEQSSKSLKSRASVKGPFKVNVEDARTLLPEPAKLFEVYCEASDNYAKFKDAAGINQECNLKASRAMIRLGEFKYAADLLQSFISFETQLTSEQKVQRFLTASAFYAKMGMSRKSSFYKRVAAMNCITAGCAVAAWLQCYHILLDSLSGYGISLDSRSLTAITPGWPDLQSRVFYELAYTARRINKPAVAVRHLCFLLHIWHKQITSEELTLMIEALQAYAAQVEVLPQPLALDTGHILMPVHFIHFPKVTSITPQPLPPHLMPDPCHTDTPQPASVFIYSPLQLLEQDQTHTEVVWVVGEICHVSLTVNNPLVCNLEVEDLTLTLEGVSADHAPVQVTLPAGASGVTVDMNVVPHQAGTLKITGISHQCFGVRSNCRLQDMLTVDAIEVKVIGALACVSVTSGEHAGWISTTSATDADSVQTSVYVGACEHVNVRVTNTSGLPVTEIKVSSTLPAALLTWDDALLASLLPLQPATSLSLPLRLHGNSQSLDVNERVESGVVSLVYRGEGGEYWRRREMRVCVTVLQCVLLKRVTISPSTAADHCQVTVHLLNVSKHDVCVTGSTSTTTIAPGDVGICHLLIPCVPLTPDLSLAPDSDVTSHVTKHCRLNWTIAELNTSGQYVLGGVAWSHDQLMVLHQNPVTVALTVEDVPLATDLDLVSCVLGKSMSLTFTLTNVSSGDVGPVTCGISSSSSALISGPSVYHWHSLAPAASVSTSLSIIFLWAGPCDLRMSFTAGPQYTSSRVLRFNVVNK